MRYLRHHSDGSSSDAGWQSGNLLLDYIAYSEQYRKSEDIEIRFGQFNGTNPTTNSDADKDFQTLRKFNIAVPGGVIGRQAIFSIFEKKISLVNASLISTVDSLNSDEYLSKIKANSPFSVIS